jgi:hypothetical protein
LGRTPESLRYHVKLLQEAGLLKKVGSRRGRTRREALYRATSATLELSGSSDLQLLEYARMVNRLLLESFERAHQEGYTRYLDNSFFNTNVVWHSADMDTEDLRQIYNLIARIMSRIRQRGSRKEERSNATRYAVSISLVPLESPLEGSVSEAVETESPSSGSLEPADISSSASPSIKKSDRGRLRGRTARVRLVNLRNTGTVRSFPPSRYEARGAIGLEMRSRFRLRHCLRSLGSRSPPGPRTGWDLCHSRGETIDKMDCGSDLFV